MRHQTTTEIIDDSDQSSDWKEGAHWGLRAGDSEDYAKGLQPIDLETKSPEWIEAANYGYENGVRGGITTGFEAGRKDALDLVRGSIIACAAVVLIFVSLSFLTDCGTSPTETSISSDTGGHSHGE